MGQGQTLSCELANGRSVLLPRCPAHVTETVLGWVPGVISTMKAECRHITMTLNPDQLQCRHTDKYQPLSTKGDKYNKTWKSDTF